MPHDIIFNICKRVNGFLLELKVPMPVYKGHNKSATLSVSRPTAALSICPWLLPNEFCFKLQFFSQQHSEYPTNEDEIMNTAVLDPANDASSPTPISESNQEMFVVEEREGIQVNLPPTLNQTLLSSGNQLIEKFLRNGLHG